MSLKSRLPEIAAELPGAVDAAMRAGAEAVAEAARERCPYDPNSSVHLRDAIHVDEREGELYVIAGNNEAWYGHLVEFGARGGNMPAEPFLLPALEEHRDTVVELARKAVEAIAR